MTDRDLVQPNVRGKLRALKASICLRLGMEGLAWAGLALAGAAAATFLVDYFFRLDDRAVRGAVVAAAMLGVLAVLWRRLLRPLAVPMGEPDLALLVERRFGQLGDRLISAIELSGRRDIETLGISSAMVLRMADEANSLAVPLRFGQVVERRGMVRAWGGCLAAAAVLAGLGAWRGDLADRWFQRNVLFRNIPWPQDTYIRVDGGPGFSVLRGDDLTVVVLVEPNSAEVPAYVTLHARYPSVGRTEERIDHDADNPRRFTKTFQAVAEEFSFYVVAGDDRRDRGHPVTLIDPPGLKKVLFTVRRPAYMNRPQPEQFDGSGPVLLVPVGGKVTVAAEANKDLASAAVVLDGRRTAEMQPQKLGAGEDASLSRRHFVGAFDIESANRPATLALTFALKDTDGYTNRHGARYVVQVQPDLPPTVEVRKQHVQAKISPSAVVPLHVKVKDDCGVAAVEVLAARRADPKDANAEPLKLPPDAARQFEGDHDLDLRALGLQPGQTVYVGARAADTLPAELGGPNVACSGLIGLNVVTPQEVKEDILTRLNRVRLEFIQAMALQETARASTAAARDIFAGGQDHPEARRQLAASAGSQSSVGSEIAKALDTLDGLLAEMRNNRVFTAEQLDGLRRKVVEPMRGLTDPIEKASAALHATREVSDVAGLHKRSTEIEQAQRRIFLEMDRIRKDWEGELNKQEMVNRLQIVIKLSEDLLRAIEEARKKEIEDALKGTTRPAKPAR